MTTVQEHLQELQEQKLELVERINKTNITADEAEVFNTLIDKVGTIVDASRVEIEYSGENIVKARLFHLKNIPAYLFYKQPLSNVELYHSDISSIGDYAFYNNNLTNFTMPDTVESIGNYAFYECPLSSIDFPDSLKTIGSNAFYGASIKSLNIPSGVISIGSRCFYECKSLKSITLPDTPVTLGGDAFGWTGITTFTFPSWLTNIPSQLFYCCKSLKLTSLPNTIVSIGSGAFQATACTFTVIPDSVTSIESRAFIGIPSTSLTIPKSVTSMGNNIFAGSASVSTLRIYCNLPDGVICDSLNRNTTLKNVEIGGNIKPRAFLSCSGLQKVWIRETCTTIETTTSASYKPFYGNTRLVIYAEADSKPDGWADDFNKISSSAYATVVYGVKESPF